MLSVVGDVPVDSGVFVVTSSISRSCRLNLLEVPIGVGLRACIHRDECACVFVSVCVYCVSKKIYNFFIGKVIYFKEKLYIESFLSFINKYFASFLYYDE